MKAWLKAFGGLGPTGDLDDERRAGVSWATGYDLAVHTFYISLLVATAVVITWFAGFVVYRLVKTPR